MQTMVQKINLQSILAEVGYIGRTQKFYLALICFITFFTGCFSVVYVFTAGDLNYRCYVDECDKRDIQSADYNPGWIKYAVPFDEDTGLAEKCSVYSFVGDRNKSRDLCDVSNFNRKFTAKCDKFVFETEEKTILTEYSLTCSENKWKLTLPGSMHSAGSCLNMLMIGYVSDRFGRKKVFIVSPIMSATFAIAQTLASNYWCFLAFKFLETCLGGGTYTAALILGLELVRPEHRTTIGTAFFALSSAGTVYFGFVAMLILNWRILILILYIPNFIIITYIWLLPESIIWLQVKRRHQHIANILLWIIKWNKIKLSPAAHDILVNKPETMFEDDLKVEPDEKCKSGEKFPILDVFRSRPMMLRILSLAFFWLATMIVFYGLSLISVTIGGNKFTDFMIASAMEIPACVLVALVSNRFGRKTILNAAFLVSGSVLIIYIFVSDIYWLKMIFFMIGKFAITMCLCTIYMYTSEMVPTNLRQTLVGVCSAVGRIGAFTAPQVPLLDGVMKHLSIYLFVGFALFAGLMAFRFPETLNCKLPDTIEEALQIGKEEENKSEVS